MCGIAGIIYFDKDRKVVRPELKAMTDTIIHRGPDDEGFYINNNVGLGFRRLSIIDLNTGNQPMCNEDETVWVVMNGEIYNFISLRNELVRRGHKFKSASDTEVLVHLYEEYSVDFITKIRGMFAIGLYDKRRNKLILARDRVGIKPLFYALTGDSLIFGSELKEIVNVLDRKPEINPRAVIDYFTYGYPLGEKTFFEGINKLLSARYLELDINNFRSYISKYWEINPMPDYSKTESEWCEIITEKLHETVKMHLISDVPLGAFLSGGVDSSSVVATMAQLSSKPIQTFSIGFKEAKYNEIEYARQVSKLYNTNHHEMILEPASVEIIDDLVNMFDEPFADSSAIPTYFVSKFARESVTVALSGDGGDELFAGYLHYEKAKQIASTMKFLPDFIKSGFGFINGALPDHGFGKGISYYLSKPAAQLGAYFTKFKDYEIRSLFRTEFLEELRLYSAIDVKIKMLESYKYKENVIRNELLDINTFLVDDILTKVDRVSMVNSLEVRVPLLDHEFIELAFSIPSALKVKKGEGKYIFKKSLKPNLPKEILYRKKQGFGVPLTQWFNNDLNAYIKEELLNNRGILSDYLNPKSISKIIDTHRFGRRDFSSQIWALLFFQIWYKKWKLL
jgi:asparagine synthase (glutamine-hydrolysing)